MYCVPYIYLPAIGLFVYINAQGLLNLSFEIKITVVLYDYDVYNIYIYIP